MLIGNSRWWCAAHTTEQVAQVCAIAMMVASRWCRVVLAPPCRVRHCPWPCVLLGLGKFNGIGDIDFDNRAVVTEPGVTNLASASRGPCRFYYAPDPSSQIACASAGMFAENSGGVHCLNTA